ncbi:ketoacyl-ACP synthase III family protein [Amycolatopsis sp. NPDC059021]|uniref:ketoacyl-ACP synthase III family protein n=1 Tax=Amycolatopsis sp. NPDC059021 TaxID=3346704 RepID=UPI00366ACA74
MRIDNVYLASAGVWLPRRMSGTEAVALGHYEQDDLIDSGLDGALVAGDAAPVDMAVSAAEQALTRAGTRAGDVDLLIHSSVFRQGPEMWAATGYLLRELGCGYPPAFEIRQGCNGMMRALEIAAGQFALVPGTALLTAADNFTSPVFDRWRGGGPGFVVGDAASSLLLNSIGGFARVRSVNSATVPELEGMHRGQEPLYSPEAGRPIDMTARALWFVHSGQTVSGANDHAVKWQLEVVHRSLNEAGITPSQVARVLFTHCAGYMVDQWIMRPLGLPMSRSAWDFGRTVGHLGASDHVVALNHLLEAGELGPGDHVLLAGGAPGYSVSAAVLTITGRPAWAGRE